MNDDLDVARNKADILLNVIDRIFRANKKDVVSMPPTIEMTEGSYPFIPINTQYLFDEMYKLKKMLLSNVTTWSGHKEKTPKFLDAGCGVGNVLIVAEAIFKKMFNEYHGIECYEDIVNKAIDLLRGYRGRIGLFKIIEENIMDFCNYAKYDMIYFYQPFSHALVEMKFEERVEDEMKIGAVLCCYGKVSTAISRDRRFTRLDEFSFIKTKNGERPYSSMDIKVLYKPNDPFFKEYNKKVLSKYKLEQFLPAQKEA